MAFKIYQGKKVTIGFENPELDIKLGLQNRIVIFWKGNSLTSTAGIISGVTTGGSIGAVGTGKVGTQSIITNNTVMSYRFNEYLRSLDQFSIGCWVYFTSFNFAGPWASWNAGGSSQGQLLLYNENGNSNTLPGFVVPFGSTNYSVYAPLNSWIVNTWHYVLCEVDRANLRLRMWVDNNLSGETVLPSGFILNTGVDTFSLGGYNLANNTISNMSGRIEEFVILTGNTTSGERNWLWNSGTGNTLG